MNKPNIEFDPAFLFEKVTQAKAEADVILDASAQRSFKVNQGDVESIKVSDTRVIGIRVVKDDKVGIAYSESFEPQALELMLNQALENAQISRTNVHEKIMNVDQTRKPEQKSDLFVEEQATSEAMLQSLLAFEQKILEQPLIESCPYNGLTSHYTARRIMSTTGADLTHLESSASLYAYALAKQNDKQSMAGTGQVARQFQDLNADALAVLVSEMTLDVLPGATIKTGHYDVLFSVDCLSSLIGVFSSVFSGKAVMDKISPWRDKLGQAVAHNSFSMVDKPLVPEFGFAPFDDEGCLTQETSIIKEGILQTHLHNSLTAQSLAAQNTGHASRSAKGSLNVSSHQLMVEPGNISLDEIHKGEYFEITQLSGLHSGANAITGDFSFGATGFLCRDGKRQQAVRGVTVAGNFYEILKELLIAENSEWNWQRTQCFPSIRFLSLNIAGH